MPVPGQLQSQRFRLTLLCGICLLLSALCWLQWSWRANAALDRELSLLRLGCQPTSASELPTTTAQDDAASALFLQAIDAYQLSGARPVSLMPNAFATRNDLPKSPVWLARAKQMLTQKPTLDLLRAARNATGPNGPSAHPLDLSQTRNERILHVSRLLNDLARYSHETGDDAAAIEYLLDSEAFFRFIYRSPAPPTTPYLNQLSALHSCATVMPWLRVIAVRLAPASSATTRPADQQQVRTLIGQLLDGPALILGYHDSISVARATHLDRLVSEPAGWCLLHPYSATLTAEMLRGYRDADQYLLQQKLAARLYTPGQAGLNLIAPDGAASLGAYDETSSDRLRESAAAEVLIALADRRMAAVGLAFRLFLLDHGQYPATLDELVPAYLPAIPRDPFAPAHEPFRYLLLNGGKRPILSDYSSNGSSLILSNQVGSSPIPFFYRPVIDLDDVPSATIPAK